MSLLISKKSTLSLEQQLDRITLESNLLDNVTGLLAEYIPGIYKKINDLGKYLVIDVKEREYRDILRIKKLSINGYKYDSLEPIAHTLVIVPYGLNTPLLEYIPAITNSLKMVNILATESLIDFNFALSKAISDSESRKTLSDRKSIYLDIDKARKEILNTIELFQTTKGARDKLPVYKVVDRISDVRLIIDSATDLSIMIKNGSLKNIKDEVDKTISLMDIVIKRLDGNDGISELSSTIVRNLAEESYIIAKVIELLTIIKYRADNVIVSTIDLAGLVLNKK